MMDRESPEVQELLSAVESMEQLFKVMEKANEGLRLDDILNYYLDSDEEWKKSNFTGRDDFFNDIYSEPHCQDNF